MNKSERDLKASIVDSLKAFQKGPLLKNATTLFNTLGYDSDKTFDLVPNSADNFLNTFDERGIFQKDKAFVKNWQSIDIIFQLSDEEIFAIGSGQRPIQFDTHQKIDNKIIQSYLFVVLRLKKGHYTRTDLSTITREINKLFPMPVFILFKNGAALTLSVINRRLHKRDASKDILEKVTLIKDIQFAAPHRAHIEILYDLSFDILYDRYRFSSFVGLHDAWRKTLDTNELNKRFYKELANWYFWARQVAKFPSQNNIAKEIRNPINVIRLITRVIFVWFVKEKGLIPEGIFNKHKVVNLLKAFSPESGSYYKAILQNLFFATLNTKMGERKFRDERRFQGKNDSYMMHNRLRYKTYFKEPDDIITILKDTPFLNGGLFECLDRETKPITRIDGFSGRSDNELYLPNYLFFSEPQIVDLNEDFGTKGKKYEVRGLIDLLQRYKFTIAENTPIEEEIALDPELLGRVFENLLAAYNPETGITARKQTGSFYTPREIVDYMVDESLKASLSNLVAEKLADTTEEDMKTGMDILFAYTEKEHAFNEEEVWKIVEAVSKLKIHDPACGSGAFPMGALHKLVYILGKLDPDNTRWRELQKQRAIKETEDAYNLGNKDERRARLREIEDAFDFNTSDYGRKLYLIENCIYGIDIQSIAVQIAKLRFFISLVVDQNVNRAKENLGIRPLPNLETKFVAANSLIGIDKRGEKRFISFNDPTIRELQNKLIKIRHKHFNSRTPKTKRKWQEKDETIREKMKKEFIILYEKELKRRINNSPEQKELEYYQAMIDKSKDDSKKRSEYEQEKQNVLGKIERIKKRFSTDANRVAQQLASWDPYDQNASAGFFDAEWMFNITDGFDVVIGNPPYVRADSGANHLILRKKIQESDQYETLWEKWDLYIPFIERGFKLLKPGGVTTMIVSDAYCHSKYAQKSQDWFLKNSRVLRLDFFSKIKIFDAGVHNITYLFQKTDGSHHKPERRVHDPEFGAVKILPSSEQGELDYRAFFPEDMSMKQFYKSGIALIDVCYITYGLRPSSDEHEAKGEFTTADLVSETKDMLHCRPFVEGKHLDFWLPMTNLWIEWGSERAPAKFCRPTFPELYEVDEKILAQRSPGPDPKACYDNHHLVFTPSSVGFIPWHSLSGVRNRSLKKSTRYLDEKPPRPDLPRREELEKTSRRFSVKFLLAVMNSAAAHNFLRANRRSNIHLYPNDWKQLPVPDVTSKLQAPVIKLVDKIIMTMRIDPSAQVTLLEAETDARVAHLYELTEEKYALILKETNCPDSFRVAAQNIYRDIAKGKTK